MALAFTLAERFRKRRHQSGYLSFMSVTSISGIALGCFVLILLLSVMNGFERELTQRLLAVIPHGELFSVGNEGIEDWQSLQSQIASDPRVSAVIPFTPVTGLIQKKGSLKAVSVAGIAPQDAQHTLAGVLSDNAAEALKNKDNGVVLGQNILDRLALSVGDNVSLLLPQSSNIQQMRAPKRLQLVVVGAIQLGGEIDSQIGIMRLDTASTAMNIVSGAKGLRISAHDPFDAPRIVRDYGYAFYQPVYMSDWTRTHGHIFQDIQLVRVVVYIVLTLVIAVACFNVVSTLVMSVRAKQASIAILMSMGATPSLIKKTFLLQGLMNGAIGTAIGTLLAVLITPNLTGIVSAVEDVFHVKVLSSDVYFIDFLPTELHVTDVAVTVLISLTLCVVAAWYPAANAARVQPAQVLS
ncbi:lipoprotein-releasing ABC transporter permease subunit [Alteromonas sediminis]|uniref:Lipoprotein-releasing ABC transporter permease subunit n=1 Tax=Alteromonas sediminis TaxID=2259342 RepID=A0A3N5ZC01_9ALTE|nr:lipoprotein-releasing ABC transporter permease subunit [Alteromonas sediminis]RPJ67288.1 lipoprotein-releasing ABC transporter permease subunit [Alteromonas sediminis]